jgi:integrase
MKNNEIGLSALSSKLDDAVKINFAVPKNVNLINEIGSLLFTVNDPVEGKDFFFDLSHPSYENNEHIRRTISELFIMSVSNNLGWSNPTTHALSGRNGTVKNKYTGMKRIGVWWATQKPNTKLSEWNMNDVKKLLEDILQLKVEWQHQVKQEYYKAKSEGVINRGAMGTILQELNRSEQLVFSGKIQDGLSLFISRKQEKKILQPILRSHNTSFEDWKQGNSHSAIPLPVAMLLLSDAIEVIRHKNTYFLIEYFQNQRTDHFYSPQSLFCRDTFQRYCNGEWDSEKGAVALNTAKAEGMLRIIKKHYGDAKISFPMSGKELSNWCNRVYSAGLVILLVLTGARISELASMKPGDITCKLDGIWDFKSEIIKTNHGIATQRPVYGLAAEAVNAMNELSYIDKLNPDVDVDIFLFSKIYKYSVTTSSFDFKKLSDGSSKATLTYMLTQFYKDFLKRHPEVKSICPSVSPHMFRHTFAEFALRRFDGNVHEAIRRHFRHSHKSFMTNIYLSNKIDEAFATAQEIMIRDIAEKMVKDARKHLNSENIDPQFFGAAMKAAIDLLDAKVISSEEELDSVIEEFAEGFEKIVPHEYGFCMPRTKTISQSQCFDKVSKVAKFEDAGFSTCSSCVHSVQEINSHEASIVQIGLTHAHQMKSIEVTTSFNLENNKQYQASMNAVKNVERVLKRMKSDKIIASSRE